MSSRSRIEWTETTWNPTIGCDRISAGCENCYALTLLSGSKRWALRNTRRTVTPTLAVLGSVSPPASTR